MAKLAAGHHHGALEGLVDVRVLLLGEVGVRELLERLDELGDAPDAFARFCEGPWEFVAHVVDVTCPRSLREGGALLARERVLDGAQVAQHPAKPIGRELQVVADVLNGRVDFMGHARCELSHRLESIGLLELARHRPFGGDVAANGKEAVSVGVERRARRDGAPLAADGALPELEIGHHREFTVSSAQPRGAFDDARHVVGVHRVEEARAHQRDWIVAEHLRPPRVGQHDVQVVADDGEHVGRSTEEGVAFALSPFSLGDVALKGPVPLLELARGQRQRMLEQRQVVVRGPVGVANRMRELGEAGRVWRRALEVPPELARQERVHRHGSQNVVTVIVWLWS